MTTPAPRVFVCHATEDKARFVEKFATALRSVGVDAWYDGWDIDLGEVLWKRISDAIGTSDVFLLVASPASLRRPWVAVEIGAGISRMLEAKARFIVIVIDDCESELPSLLKGMRYLKIANIADFKTELAELVESVFGYTRKPPLGPAPRFATAPTPPTGLSLTPADWEVLSLLSESTLSGIDGLIQPETCQVCRTRSGLTDDSFVDSLEALEHLGLLKLSRGLGQHFGRGIHHVIVAPSGFEAYLSSSLEGYQLIKKQVLVAVVAGENVSSDELKNTVDCPFRVLRHIVEWIDQQRLAKVSFYMGPTGSFAVMMPDVRLRRMVQS